MSKAVRPASPRGVALRVSLVSVVAVVGAMTVYAVQPDARDRHGDVPLIRDPPIQAPIASSTLGEPGRAFEPTCPPFDARLADQRRQFTRPPPMCMDPTRTYTVTLATNRGSIDIMLWSRSAPIASNTFYFLAGWLYYNGVGFHSVVEDAYLATGDPFGPVAGDQEPGPGFEFPDEPPTEDPPYPPLSVVMAPAGPDRNRGQFLIVTGDEAQIPPTYTRLGTVVGGADVVEEIAATATSEGQPTEPTVIEAVFADSVDLAPRN